MNDPTAFEVFRTETGWRWRLRHDEAVVAVSDGAYETSGGARESVDRVRGAAATLEHIETSLSTPAKPRIRVESAESGAFHSWSLVDGDETLAIAQHTYPTREEARSEAMGVEQLAFGALPVYLAGADDEGVDFDPFDVGLSQVGGVLSTLLRRGREHRRYLEGIDTRIVVSGIRGKSSTTRRLDDVFNRRGYDTLTKITGNQPHLIRNGDVIPIRRNGPHTTLYENINVLREFGPQLERYTPEDVAIFENQGITEYTTRLINERFVRPHVVVIANVRQDHQDTLGKTLPDIARAFARTVPSDTTVVCGEQNPVLYDYMRAEVEDQGATMVPVEIPPEHDGRIGAETVYATNTVLRELGYRPVPDDQLGAYLDAIQPDWVRLPGGRVFNGAEVNDIESTEAVRDALAGDDPVLPFVFLRSDRRSRTASFAAYLDTLAERGLIDHAHCAGDYTDVFARNVSVPVERHDRSEGADAVLDDLLDSADPVLLMGNTVDDFMRDMEAEIESRAQIADAEPEPESVAPVTVEPSE